MRQMVSRYTKVDPFVTKKSASVSFHVSAPSKGLSLQNKLTPGDPLTATVLKNFVIDDDRITMRAGYRKIVDTASNAIIWHLIPHYGTRRMLAATNNTLIEIFSANPGGSPPTPPVTVQGGFTGNDWHWTSFSNLGDLDYTVMVNGKDGVWSWDGTLTTDPAAVPVTAATKANPVVVTVGAADIAKFKNGQTVVFAGATGTGWININGPHVVTSVNVPVNTMTLAGVDCSGGTLPLTGTVTANAPGAMQKETIAVPSDATWINPNGFQIVLSHMNRLWFADGANLAVYYLPIQQKGTEAVTGTGRLRFLPLNVLFKRGGTIRAMATWTMDGGQGMEDHIVIFSTNGEAVIYGGTDPDSDFTLRGIFKFDSPLSKHAVINWGGDVWAFVSTGMIPLSTMLRAETEQLGQLDRNVISIFLKDVVQNRQNVGWQAFLNPSTQRLFCNIPLGKGRYKQMIRHMPKPVWSEFADIPARCWGWIDPYVYFGDEVGNVYEMHPIHRSDDGKPINVDVQFAWSQFKTSNMKQYKMVKVHALTDGVPALFVDMRVDYEQGTGVNKPEVSGTSEGSAWDTSTWAMTPTEPPDGAHWAPGSRTVNNWTGVASRTGYTGAVRISGRLLGCNFAIAGVDVTYEIGATM